jgi:hypothetical protein
MKLLLALTCVLLLNVAHAADHPALDHPEVDADLLHQMILDSTLIHCVDSVCVDYDKKQPVAISGLVEDGYSVIFPNGKYSLATQQKYADAIADFYSTYVTMY